MITTISLEVVMNYQICYSKPLFKTDSLDFSDLSVILGIF